MDNGETSPQKPYRRPHETPEKRITQKRISHHLQASIARNVRHHRLRRRMTLAELAYESACPRKRSGPSRPGDPRASTLEALAAVMRVDMRELTANGCTTRQTRKKR